MCRSCRFEKCVDAGMNPSAIQADVKSSDGDILKKEIMMKQRSSYEGLGSPPVGISRKKAERKLKISRFCQASKIKSMR